jgi:superfamily I DNA/RNA helicase
VIPDWFIEEAEDLCRETLQKGDGKPIEQRIEGAIGVFKGLGVSEERLEQKLGRKKAQWTGADIAQLLITHKSIQRREIAVEDEFPQARITGGEIKSNANRGKQSPPGDDPWAGEPTK